MSDGLRKRITGSLGEPAVTKKGANAIDKQFMSLNESILNDIFNIYTDKDIGLCRFGKLLDVEVRVPRRKINVLLLGNHSAGKSSFINWYIEETILKTGVATETQGFNFVVSGKKRDTLKGQATLQLYPHLKPLQDYPGWFMGFLGIFLPVLLFLSLIVANATVEAMRQHIGQAADIIRTIINPAASVWLMVPPAYHLQVVTFVVCMYGALLIASRFSPSEATIPSRELKILRIAADVVEKTIEKEQSMFTDYLRQSVADEDFAE